MKLTARKLRRIIREELDRTRTHAAGNVVELGSRDFEYENHPTTHTIIVNYSEEMKPKAQDKFPTKMEVIGHLEGLAGRRPVRFSSDGGGMYVYPPADLHDKSYLVRYMDRLADRYPGTRDLPVYMFRD